MQGLKRVIISLTLTNGCADEFTYYVTCFSKFVFLSSSLSLFLHIISLPSHTSPPIFIICAFFPLFIEDIQSYFGEVYIYTPTHTHILVAG